MVGLKEAMDSFLLSCQADGLSPATVRWYAGMLSPMRSRWPQIQINEIDAQMMRQYVVDLRSRGKRFVKARNRPELDGGLSVESVRAHLRAMRRFFNWCVGEDYLDPASNPMIKIRMPARQHHQPKAIALEDLKRLIDVCGQDPIGKRDRALLLFLADTGARAGGALSLTWSNLQIERGRALVTEKGDRARVVPFTPITGQALADWLSVCPVKSEFVFCGLRSDRKGAQMTIAGLSIRLVDLKARAGVTGRVNPHSFRHGFAREYLRNGGDLGTLSRILGHSDVSVTVGFYAVFQDEELALFHEQYSPLKSLKGS